MSRADGARLRLEPGDPGYPAALLSPTLREAPPTLLLRGEPSLLRLPLLALFCSVRVPPELVLPVYDLARALREAGVPVIGGFQSPLERECLDYLLRGRQPVVLSPARGIDRLRLPPAWSPALEGGRMLVVSRFERARRPTRALATRRNRLVAALAERVLVAHASPGGGLRALAREALARGRPVLCLDHPANRDLALMGAAPIDPAWPGEGLLGAGALAAPPPRR